METRNRSTLFKGLVVDIEQFEVRIGEKGWHTFQIVRHPPRDTDGQAIDLPSFPPVEIPGQPEEKAPGGVQPSGGVRMLSDQSREAEPGR
jgi:hypothetical protein